MEKTTPWQHVETARPAPRTWLFDLDNTLHDANVHIFPKLGRAMVEYIRRHLDVDEDEAIRLRQKYWSMYGATLLGLMRHHAVDPDHFLHHTHQFSGIERLVVAERGLKDMLKRLPGKKILFSNAPYHYVETLLAVLGIRYHFSAIYSIERLRYHPKPAISGFLRILRQERLNPRRCVMVEDTLNNLKTARALHMKTVWVSTSTRCSPYVDIKLASVLDLPKYLGRL